MAEAQTAEEGQKPANGPGLAAKLLMPLLAVLNLGVLGGGAFLAYKATLGYKHPTIREPQAVEELQGSRKQAHMEERVMYTLPTFTVNLDGTPRRLIRVEMTFEMLDKEGFEEIVRNNPRVRDEIVRILNRKKFDDIETIQGKLLLKDQITVTLNQALKAGVIKDIYFSDFLVQ